MKKTLSLFLALTILLSLTGCSFSKTEDTENQAEKEVKKEVSKEVTKDKKEDKKEKNKKSVSSADLLKNIHVRKAIALAIDKKTLAEDAGNTSQVINYLIPESFAFDNNEQDFRAKYPDGFLAYNPEKAKEEWQKAKEELGFDEAELEILTFNGEDAGRMISQISDDLSKSLDGLTIKANQQSFEQKAEFSKLGKFHIDLQGWIPDYVDPMAYLDLFSANSTNNSGKFNNSEYEKLLEEAKNTTDFAKRFELLQEAEKILIENVAIIPLYQDSDMYLIRPYIKNLIKNPFNTSFAYKFVETDKIVDSEELVSVLGGADGSILDVNNVIEQSSIQLLSNIKEGLISFDEEGKAAPGIAETWEVSEDNMQYTFYLRNSQWSNGDPVTAQDFVDSWQRLGSSELKSEYATMLETAGIKNAMKVINGDLQPSELGVKAIDNYTLQVTLDRPVPYFLDLMGFTCFYPINKKFVEETGEDYGSSIDTVLYNGPYKITSWDIGYGLDLKKNETYWDIDNVRNDGVKYRMAKDLDTALAMYDNHDIDICPLDGEATEQRKNSPDFVSYKVFAVFYLILNNDLNLE